MALMNFLTVFQKDYKKHIQKLKDAPLKDEKKIARSIETEK